LKVAILSEDEHQALIDDIAATGVQIADADLIPLFL
jgi:hypothetical protein